MICEVGEKIFIHDATREMRTWCRENLIIDNPEYSKKERMGLWTGSTPRTLQLYEEVEGDLRIPFGCLLEIRSEFPDMPMKSRICFHRGVNYASCINPYPYQENAIQAAVERRNGILVMPCGAGKTQTALEVIARVGMKCLWLTHTQDLLNQSMNRAKSVLGIDAGSYGTITGGRVRIGSGITFATVQTLSRIDLVPYRDEWGVIVVDECLPGDTKILTATGEKPLKSLRNGDIVASYNRECNQVEYKPVINTFKLKAHDIYKITLSNGNILYATGNHPFFVKKKGWIRADEIVGGMDYVMQFLRCGDRRKQTVKNKSLQKQKKRLGLLFKRMFVKRRTKKAGLDAGTKIDSRGDIKESQYIAQGTNHRKNDAEQSHEKSKNERSRIKAAERNRTSSKNSVWERDWDDCSAANACAGIGGFNECIRRISDSHKDAERQRLSDMLQGRYCDSRSHDSDRGGRKFARRVGKTKARHEENRFFDWIRVESVTVRKQTGDGTFGGVCSDGCVYNIEVDDNNNYFANGVLVHNCHKAVGTPTKAMQFYRVISALSCRYKYGITATPKRSDGLHRTMTALLGDIIYTVDREDVADTTCPVTVEQIRTGYEPDTSIALCGDGTINYAGLVSDMTHNRERFNLVREVIDNNCSGPTLVLANRVEYLSLMNDSVKKKSICLSSMGNSKKAKAERKDALRKLNDGKIDCIFATYQLAAEGLDCPNLRYVVFATPEKNERIVEQASGRVARKAEGKNVGTIIDLIDDFGMLYGWSKKRTNLYKKLGYAIM